MASRCKKPAQLDLVNLKDLQECIAKADSMRDNRSAFANHQNMVSEGVHAVGWICVERTPKPFIESYIEGLDFWGNKIRVQHKSSNPDHVEFVDSFKALLVELMAYVKAYHTTGVTWNRKGGDVASFTPSATTKSDGEVPKSVVAGAKSNDQVHRKTIATEKPNKPPVCEERNGNWRIESQTEEPASLLKVLNVTLKQQVYIFGCEGATLVLEGKAKNIILDSCTRTKLVLDDAVSSLEIVNCSSVQVQVKGKVPLVAIDNTDGCLVFISWQCRDVQFITSKSSEMNVALPTSAKSDDYVEKPIPEQFVLTIADNLSISSDLYAH